MWGIKPIASAFNIKKRPTDSTDVQRERFALTEAIACQESNGGELYRNFIL